MEESPGASEAVVPAGEPGEPPAGRLTLLLALGSLLALVPVWCVPYPPMVDLPQHAAQVGLWKLLGQPGYPYADLFEFNAFTPYLVGYVPGRILAEFMPAYEAVRCLVSLAVVALPWCLRAFLARVGGDPWWAFLGIPLAFGFAFYFGFLTYIVAVPVGLLYLTFVFRYADAPTLRGGVLLSLFTLGLFFCHALVFGACGLAAAIVIAARAPTPRAVALRWAPLVLALPLVLIWLKVASGEAMTQAPIDFDLNLARLGGLPNLLLGRGLLALSFAALLSFAIVLGAARVTTDPARRGLALLGLALWMLAPATAFGTYYLHARFSLLVAPFLLCALEPREEDPQRRLGRVTLVALACVWPLVLAIRFQPLADDAADFHRVQAAVEAPAEVFAIAEEDDETGFTGIPFRHYGALLQLERPILAEPSFCRSFPTVIRYRRGVRNDPVWPKSAVPFERYDYLLIRSSTDSVAANPELFTASQWAVVEHSGRWWLYRRQRR